MAEIDRSFVEQAVRTANPNALRLALYHQTGDPRLAAMPVGRVPVQGGAMTALRLDRSDHETLWAIAADHLLAGLDERPPPSKAETADLLTLFTGATPDEAELHWAYEDLAFDEFPHDAAWNERPDPATLAGFHVTIIGAGFSGIAIGIQLDRLGIPYRIVEKHEGVGGTWYINDYPQARVDIPSYMYQYRFVKNYPWRSYFATGAELKDYLATVIDDYDLAPKISLSTELTEATWDDERARWRLTLTGADGATEQLDTNVVVSCVGLFNRPNLPAIDGIESFSGAMFHTTAWNHDYDYRGRRVALIGTGSTGSQLMPEVAEKAGHLSVFQRTANWVNPVNGYKAAVTEHERWLLDTLPGYWNWVIHATSRDEIELQTLQEMDPDWVAGGGRVNEHNDRYAARLVDFIASKVDDEELAAKLVPPYAPLARRLVIDNGFYDALGRDNVDLVTDPIARITETGITTTDPETGDERDRPFDLIVLGAGFKVGDYLWPVAYAGRDGVTLEELWRRDGARAYLGLTMPNYPNFFCIYGPNGQARGGSFHAWAAAFGRYIGGLLVHLIEHDKRSFEVRADVFERYNADMDDAHRHILWEHEGGGGYYVNAHGRSGVNMPWTQAEYYEMIREPDPEDYEFR